MNYQYFFIHLFLFFPVVLGIDFSPIEAFSSSRTGKDFALFFAVDNYEGTDWKSLKNPVKDAEALAEILNTIYGFEPYIYKNKTREEIESIIEQWKQKDYPEDAQLFVFFSGHGQFIERYNRGYFIPKNANNRDVSKQIELTILADMVSLIPCNHILLTIDACYSGTADRKIIFKGDDFTKPSFKNEVEKHDFIRRKLRFKSKLLLTSGGKERTPDGVHHSPLVYGILNALRETYTNRDGLLSFRRLLADLERVNPTPHYGELLGHESGGFIFIAKPTVTPISPIVPVPQQPEEEKRININEGPLYKLASKGVTKGATSIYSSPSQSSIEGEILEPFTLVFLYPPTNYPGITKNGFYWVGLGPDHPIGWVPADKIREWDSRICLHFTSPFGREPALVWPDQDIEGVLRGYTNPWPDGGDTPSSKAIAQEPKDLSQRRYSMLLPALDQKRLVSGGKLQKAYKIGFLSGGNDQSSSNKPVTTVQRGPAAVLELMFLIDATSGMQPYIDGTKQVIEAVANRIRTSHEGGIQVGLMCYRDYIQNQSEMEFVTAMVHPLTRNVSDVVNAMSYIREAPVGSEDYPEAGFDGLYAAVTETDWNRTKSSLRVIVYIGDASAHPAGDDKNPFNYSLEQIVDVCSQNRVIIIGIKIVNDDYPEDNQLHRKQMLRLTQGKTDADKGYYGEIRYGQIEAFKDQLTKAIEEEINRMSILENVSTKGTQFMPNLAPSDKAIILKDLTHTHRHTPIQYSEGWIQEFDKNGTAFVKPYAHMSAKDLDLLHNYLSLILEGLYDPRKIILNTIWEALNIEMGSRLDSHQRLDNYYEKIFGLYTTSDMLNFTLEEIEGWGEARRRRVKELIESKAKLLKTHMDSSDKWFKIPGTQYQYTFVPLSDLP